MECPIGRASGAAALDNANHDPKAVGWPSKCTWSQDKPLEDSPHQHQMPDLGPVGDRGIQNSILDHIGGTPVIRLSNLMRHHNLKCELVAKCEFLNPGGSVKDRIAWRMVQDAEREGRLVPNAGYTIIEPTSGNTGIGLAMVSAVRGYKCIIVMPQKMSREKENMLRALGAQIIRTPTEARYDSPDSHISKAIELNKSIDKSVILNQYRAPGNPLAHYDTTAEELLAACNNHIDAVVSAAGTGGTICGLARKIKQRLPECHVVGVDPVGSILAEPEELNVLDADSTGLYEVEGIGYDFIPTVLDRSTVDLWIKTEDEDSFSMARDLIRLEGLLVGGSSGSAVYAALQAIDRLGYKDDAGRRVAILLPDSSRNYINKFIDDDWMRMKNFNTLSTSTSNQ